MKPHITSVNTRAGLDPRRNFGPAWLAAFFGIVLILGVVFFAMLAFG